MKLFYALTSPFARKVLIVAKELDLEDRIELVLINPWTDEELRAANPFCQVPTLVLGDGEGLHDSPVICDFLDGLAGGKLFPASGPPRARALKLQALGDGVCAAAVRRVRERMRPEAERNAEMVERQALAMAAGLDVMERKAAGLAGRFDIGEIAFACTLGYLDLRFPDEDWRPGRPGLEAWFKTLQDRPSFAQTRPPAG